MNDMSKKSRRWPKKFYIIYRMFYLITESQMDREDANSKKNVNMYIHVQDSL